MHQVSGGFLIKKNKLLFGKRSKKKKWAPGTWDIAGGHALPGEDPVDTLKRETLEEVGVTVLHAKLLASIVVPDENKNKDFMYHIYMITSWKGKVYNASHEHTKIRWFTRKQLMKRKLSMPEYMELIDDWFNSQEK